MDAATRGTSGTRVVVRAAEIVDVAWKYVRSFRTRNWTLSDYPIRITNRAVATKIGKFSFSPWTAAIVNWGHMRGDGGTRAEALANLREAFERRRAVGRPLPRPGTGEKLQLEFATRTLVEQYDDIAADFMPKVIGVRAGDCFLSDESSLADFPDASEEYLRRIGIFYGIHPDELADDRLVTIFARIAARASS